jgi:hypothetical protein
MAGCNSSADFTLSAPWSSATFDTGTLVTPVSLVPGAVQLVTTASLSQLGDGTYGATVTVRNNGTRTAQKVTLTSATLGSAAGTVIPQSLGDLQPGASISAMLVFPGSAGAPGSTVVERYSGSYTGGTFGGSIRAMLPSGGK